MKDDRILLEFIINAIDRIVRYTEAGEDAFYQDEKTQDAVLRNFQTMGNAAGDLSDETQSSHPEIEWSDVIGFRNVIVHDYLGLDLPTVWSIIDQELRPLREKIAMLL
ncbi:MAG TPA: HepT-like ribonuclease domain-containing protein [Candidatus Kapabacteria bacterium]|jgi:uncharacterized protein with HEPN domain|nr:HepT-like ribonuclease domain-containing protein [Candidatus Kapabacteria bacterium]